MPNYKLTYFNGRGRAEAARLLFAAAGVEFEDVRLEREQWQKLKPTTTIDILPSLEFEGKRFTQSRAIVYYLAKVLGFYPSSNIGGFHVDEVIFIIEDFASAAIKVRFAPEDKKAEMSKEFTENSIPKYCGWLEKILKTGTGFFYEDKMTVADIVAFDLLTNLERTFPGFLEKYALLKALVDKVGADPKIKSYIEKRPDTQF